MNQAIDTCGGCKFIGAHRCDTCARKYLDRYEKKPPLVYIGGGCNNVFQPQEVKYHDDRTIVFHGYEAIIAKQMPLRGACGGGEERNGGGC